AVHLGLSLLCAWLITTLYRDVIPDDVLGNWGFLLGIVIGLPVVLGLVHSEVVAVYLMIASRFGINLNELMAGQSIEDHKGFLRMHIDAEGTLRIYPIKVDKVCRRWVADPRGEAGDPLLRPRNFQLRPRLIQDPIVVAKHDQPETCRPLGREGATTADTLPPSGRTQVHSNPSSGGSSPSCVFIAPRRFRHRSRAACRWVLPPRRIHRGRRHGRGLACRRRAPGTLGSGQEGGGPAR